MIFISKISDFRIPDSTCSGVRATQDIKKNNKICRSTVESESMYLKKWVRLKYLKAKEKCSRMFLLFLKEALS